ncbi:ABC transporter permease [Actinoplanes cyaneus]|uniref:ABC transporter permease n=1 Tax=Actinoplanes cyaneus TaxID=52696 RepID=A0A919IQC4_9ACTN|nr:ABC transporter permease [Actinoplanes cyaneus]MCW2141888.1 putative ABC transport system permease protein [Actinoplanes cyaneus]GID68507.1 ABC transporter permease [Actinoplanes cyaneus]
MSRLGPRDLLGVGLIGIRTRKMRALLSALGISIGIATMVVVTGIPASSQADLLRTLSALGTNTLQAAPVDRDPPVTLPEGAPAMVARIGPVLTASAVANTHTVIRRNDRTDAQDGLGLTVLASKSNLLTTLKGTVRTGRFLDATSERLPMVVLGSVAATRLGFSDLPAGTTKPQVMIGDQWFTVIGILHSVALNPDIDRAVLIGWNAAQTLLHFDGHPTVIYLQAQEDYIEAVRAVLPATVDPQHPSDVRVTAPSDALAAKRATQTSFSALFLGLAAVALLVGGIGVANTMVISVLERRAEIGLRRALGAHRGQIRAQFLTEAVVLSALGGIGGTLLGITATTGYAWSQNWPVVIPAAATLAGLGGAALIGAVAGAYPAMRAARLMPSEALSGT